VSDDQYSTFIVNFREKYSLVKRGIQLQRGKITHSTRKAVIRYLKFHRLPKNADKYVSRENQDEMQRKFAEECHRFWKDNWDGK
jgi:hypothetical protein